MNTQNHYQFQYRDFRDFAFKEGDRYLLTYYCEMNDDLSTFACVSSTEGLEAALGALYAQQFSYYDDVKDLLSRSGIFFIMDQLPRNGEYVRIGRVEGY